MKKVLSFFKSWEFFLICLLAVVCVVFNMKDSANLAAGLAKKDVFNFANIIKGLRPYMLYSFMTLGMMLILALGDMDISVGSIATLSVVVLAILYRAFSEAGMALPVAFVISIAACLLCGVICGLINGLLVTRFKELFPMIITLATQLFFRGFSYLLIGGETITFKDDTFKSLKELNALIDCGSFKLPVMIPIFLVFALVFFVILHLTPVGRRIFAIGTNATTARFSGIRVDRIKVGCYITAGLTSAITGLFFVGATSSSVKADIMDGYHMYAIAAAVLGGFSTDGGKGSVIGAVISLFIFGIVKIGLGTLFGFADSSVNLSVGIILILSVLIPNISEDIKNAKRVRKQRAEAAAKA
jgi:rhamnose transport system permease protein